MKKTVYIIIALACLAGVAYFMFSPSEEEIKQDKEQQQEVKEEADSTASEKLDELDNLDFDADLGEGMDADTLGK
ncbi:MAG: hypothetical protein ACLGGV_08540 [Bacteroidia bacterium]